MPDHLSSSISPRHLQKTTVLLPEKTVAASGRKKMGSPSNGETDGKQETLPKKVLWVGHQDKPSSKISRMPSSTVPSKRLHGGPRKQSHASVA